MTEARVRKLKRAFFFVTLLCLVTGIVLTSAYLWSALRGPDDLGPLPVAPANDSTFVFMSDTQSPLWPETFFLKKTRNEAARSMLFRSILKDRPGAVFHGGDIVALGFNQDHWKPIDEFTAALGQDGIPFYPILGNHEYMVFRDTGLRNFAARYPHASLTGYCVEFGPLAFVLLNSNFSVLGSDLTREQEEWYEATMDSLDASSLVCGIIVACHHSPYTNSLVVGPSEEVQEQFVPRFTSSPKGKVFISGHAHAFEHFRRMEKDYLVIGGGGGLHQPLLEGEGSLEDLFRPEGERRVFHYVLGRITPEGIRLRIRMLTTDLEGIDEVYSISLSW